MEKLKILLLLSLSIRIMTVNAHTIVEGFYTPKEAKILGTGFIPQYKKCIHHDKTIVISPMEELLEHGLEVVVISEVIEMLNK